MRSKKYFYIITICLFTIIFILSAGNIIIWEINNRDNKKILEEISKFVSVGEKYVIDFESLKEINEQTVGWIEMKSLNISNAVVQSNDNNYYIYNNFMKKNNGAGWIFADYRNKLDGSDKNIIIYGHNMTDNSMFGNLDNVFKEDWYNNEENYIIDFITEKRQQKYQVFSMYKTQKEDYYIKTEFEENEFEKFINRLKDRSIRDFNAEVSTSDRILTLSTCSNDEKNRIVIHAKKIIN